MYAIILSKTYLNHISILGKPFLEYTIQALSSFISPNRILCFEYENADKQALDFADEEEVILIPQDIAINEVAVLKESHMKYKNGDFSPTIFHSSTKEDGMISKESFCFMWMKMKDLKKCISNRIASIEEVLDLFPLRKIKVSKKSVKRLLNLQQIAEYENELETKIQKKWQEKGVYIENPKTVLIGPDVYFLGPAIVRGCTQILGKTVCYSNAILGPNSEIIDSVLQENVRVVHSVIEESSIGKDSVVGPFAHIRNHASIGEKNRIGNFVEIKNSTTGNKTYAAHLSYIGDTLCGSGVNFGCGVVTVNYDGKHKHSTWIGDNVFIGCNSNLVAPIVIDSNSFIAAGSTIVESMNQGDFAIARATQITKRSYADKYGYKRIDES